jgi:threonine/homoserine/homoserine lactone efflux protein
MTQTLVALVIFLFPLAYSPGPGNLFFAANGARFGLRATLPASLGYHLATFAVTAAIGLGLLNALQAMPQAFAAMKALGAAYVMWIAVRMLRTGASHNLARARPASFIDGAVLLLFNPKAYVIIALMFSQFLPGSATGQAVLVLAISLVFTLNNLLAFTLWTAAGDRLAACFADRRQARALNIAFGLLLAVVAIWMVIA